MIVGLTGCKQPIKYAPRSQATLVRNRIGSPRLAKADIGFEAQVILEEGLRELIAWRSAHIEEVTQRRVAAGVKDG